MEYEERYPNFTSEQQVGQKYQRNFIKCHNKKCPNQVKIPNDASLTSQTNIFCQQCIDKYSLKDTFKNINSLEYSISEKEIHIEDLKNKITNIRNEVKDLKEELFLEKIHIKYDVDVVSENEKFYQGSDGSTSDGEYNIELETHCTIVRVEQSPENVYFGHVTLVIRYLSGLEFRWHYGTYVSYNKIPNRRNLVHDFWSKNDEHTRFPPSSTKVKSFGYFEHIPQQTTLGVMMKHHLDKCAEYFMSQKQKQRWPSQVWYEHDQVGVGGKIVRAAALVDRLQETKGNRASNPYKNLESLRLKRLEEEDARRVLALQAKQTKLANQANQAKPKQPKKEKEKLQPEELKRIKDEKAQEREQQSIRDTEEQERNQELQLQFDIEEQERLSEKERIRKNRTTRARRQRQRIANQGIVEEQDKFNQDIQEHLEKVVDTKKVEDISKRVEEDITKTVQKKEVTPQNIKELKAKNDTNRLLESIEENRERCIKMEEQINKLENVNPISADVFALRKKLYDTYGSLVEGIDENISDVQLNRYLKGADKTAVLESLHKQKEYLYSVYGVLASKDIQYMVDSWEEFYNKEILPKKDILTTLLDPSDVDAVRIRRELIRYYRIFIANCDDHVKKYIPPFVAKSEKIIIVRKILKLRHNIVNADTCLDDLCKIERDFLKEFYKKQKDDLNEEDALIAENMTILYPKKFDTLERAKFYLDNFESFKQAKALRKLSTKNVISFSKYFEGESPS